MRACMHVCQMTGVLDSNTVGRTMRLSRNRHGTVQGMSLRLNSSNFNFIIYDIVIFTCLIPEKNALCVGMWERMHKL